MNKKILISATCLLLQTAFLSGYDAITRFIDSEKAHTAGTNTPAADTNNPARSHRPRTFNMLHQGSIDLIYLNEKFYLYPKLDFFKVNFFRPHKNLNIYLMSMQLSTAVFQELAGGDGQELLPYMMITPHSGIISMELIARGFLHHNFKNGTHIGMRAVSGLKFNSYQQINTNNSTVATRLFPSFYGEAGFFGQTDLGMGDVQSSDKGGTHYSYDFIGFFHLGVFAVIASKTHITEAFGATKGREAYGFHGDLGVIVDHKHEFRMRISRLFGADNFLRAQKGYDTLLYRLSFNMKF